MIKNNNSEKSKMITSSSSKLGSQPPIAYISINHASHKYRTSRSLRSANVSAQERTVLRRQQGRGLMDIASRFTSTIAWGVLMYLGAFLTYSLVNNFNEMYYFFRVQSKINVKLRVPTGLHELNSRALSLNLGGGNCKWQPPVNEVPTNIDFYKTVIVGFPSGDKRMTFMQMEALTGWPAKDEWDFVYLGDSNHPFIKANYPHHEGIWGWGTNADQVVLVIKNLRKSLVEYHDILWDIGYAKTWDEATLNLNKLYEERPPLEDFYHWRDMRIIDEIQWYGWFIDYWMEGGLYRDIFTHKLTTPEHWNMLMMPFRFKREELDYDLVVGPDTVVTPSYDPHCENRDISGGCSPVSVVSAEKLLDLTDGPAETAAIANVLMSSAKMSPYVIHAETWGCIWDELIVHRKGAKTFVDRPNTPHAEDDYNFSTEMLDAMITELNRLIAKYSSTEWNSLGTANRIVELLTWHLGLIQAELDEMNLGRRELSAKDFLGPTEREKRRLANLASGEDGPAANSTQTGPNTEYFDAMARERMARRRYNARKAQLQRRAQRKDKRRAEKKSLRTTR